jgi:hypothetical protein
VTVFSREEIAANDRRHHRKRPECGKTQDHQRHGKARLLDGPAEERIGRQAVLQANDRGEDEWPDEAHGKQDAGLHLGRELRPLDGDDGGQSSHTHDSTVDD